MPPAFLAVPDQMTVTEDMHMMGQRRLGNLEAFQNMAGTLFPITRIDAGGCALQLLLFRCREKQAMAERQERISVAPAEREHAESFHVCTTDMVVDARQQFHFLGAVAAEEGVVDDEDIPPGLACQWCNGLPDDGRAQEQRESAPMDGAGVQEAVKGILLKGNGFRSILLPLIEGTMMKCRFKGDKKDGQNLETAQLVCVASAKNLSDMEFCKKLQNLRRNQFTGVMMMCYNIHGISPPFVLWIFSHFHYTKRRGLMLFLFGELSLKINRRFSNCEV